MMLVAAKWREFSNINPNLQQEQQDNDSASTTQSTSPEEGYSKPQRARASKEAASKIVEVMLDVFILF